MDARRDAHLAAEHDVIVEVGAAGDADLPASSTLRPTVTPWPICTRLSILVPALMRVSPTAGRSTVVLAPSSTSSSMTTVATWGIFSCVLHRPYARMPEPSPPMTTPFWRITRWPIVTRSRYRHAGMDDAVVADTCAGTDGDVGVDDEIVRSPIAAPFPNRDKCADRYVRAELGVGGQRRQAVDAGRGTPGRGQRPTARANARYGSLARSIAHGAAGASSLRITAEARSQRSDFSYFGLARKVMSPDSACLNARDAVDVDVPTPSSRQSSALCGDRAVSLAENCNAP